MKLRRLNWLYIQVRDFVRWLRSRSSNDAFMVIIGASFDLNELHLKQCQDLLKSLAENKGYNIS